MRLKDKVILVTSSTRGIGYAIVSACAAEGAIVYMAARNEERANARIAEFTEKGYTVKFVYNDATKPETFRTMIDEVVEKEGKIDVLVNNFGTSDPKKDLDIEHTTVDDFLKFVDLNMASVFISSQAAIPHMKENGGGSIINISSIGGIVPDISQIAYGTSKAGIIHMSKMIAVQEARNNIRCNVVAPGMTATDGVKDNLNENFQNMFLKNTPIKRMAEPDEIAQAVVYFASDAAAYTTGQVMAIAGGFGLATPIFGDLSESLTNR